MTYMAWIDGDDMELPDAATAVAYFDQRLDRSFLPDGTQGGTIVFGPVSDTWASGPLRVELDVDADRASVLWVPDSLYAVDLPPTIPIRAGFDYPDEIPAERVRVSVGTASLVVEEYVSTGRRPTCVRWEKL